MKLFSPAFLVIGLLLLGLSVCMLVPALMAFFLLSGNTQAYLQAAMVSGLSGGALWLTGRIFQQAHGLQSRQMFLITAGAWLLLPLFGSLPFLYAMPGISITDAVFESISGMTTTGSTVFSGLDDMAPDILLWRSMLQWLGGVGIIGMAAAVLPFLRIGGMRLFQTESSDWSEKSLPRTQTLLTRIVWVYFGISFLCLCVYLLLGMDLFNAVNHAMTTVSTGGYSTSDSSFGQFGSMAMQWAATSFMLLGSIPFVLYVRYLKDRKPGIFLDVQVKGLLGIIVIIAVLLSIPLIQDGYGVLDAVTLAIFNLTSVITTTGYASVDYMLWGNFAIVIFLFATFIGGCSGSTSGGVKIFRIQLCLMLIAEQFQRAVHPRAEIARKYNGHPVSDDIVTSLVVFLFVMIIALVLLTLLLSSQQLDIITSLSGAATALMNVGPGLGDIIGPAGNFSSLTPLAKWALCFGMIIGRLEFMTILILFTVSFWRA
ncbi:MAG: TrkH family potassium uptake protein [Pseudomonadales bacterium]|nr:TrkH family potassium uptake protein [Pseudomonadales bacterium]